MYAGFDGTQLRINPKPGLIRKVGDIDGLKFPQGPKWSFEGMLSEAAKKAVKTPKYRLKVDRVGEDNVNIVGSVSISGIEYIIQNPASVLMNKLLLALDVRTHSEKHLQDVSRLAQVYMDVFGGELVHRFINYLQGAAIQSGYSPESLERLPKRLAVPIGTFINANARHKYGDNTLSFLQATYGDDELLGHADKLAGSAAGKREENQLHYLMFLANIGRIPRETYSALSGIADKYGFEWPTHDFITSRRGTIVGIDCPSITEFVANIAPYFIGDKEGKENVGRIVDFLANNDRLRPIALSFISDYVSWGGTLPVTFTFMGNAYPKWGVANHYDDMEVKVENLGLFLDYLKSLPAQDVKPCL